MSVDNLQMMAGAVSSVILMMGTLPMLYKAWRTKDLRSYSLPHIICGNVGNLLHWAYVLSLPPGPTWVLQGFYTMATFLMLVWYLTYNRRRSSGTDERTRQTLTHRKVF